MILSTSILIVHGYLSYRQSLVNEMVVQAKIVGANCKASLSFDDPKSAKETLGALRASPNIVSAAIYSADRKVFAALKYKDAKEELLSPSVPQSDGHHIGIRSLDIFHGIFLDGERIGTIYIRLGLKGLYVSLMWYAGTVGVVASFSLGIAFLMLLKLQKKITRPILLLRHATDKISKGDLTTRAEVLSCDELGQLADSFNSMTDNLKETTVSRNYVDGIIDNMMDCLIVVSDEGKIQTVNQAALDLLCYTDGELLNEPLEKIFEEEFSFNRLIVNHLLKDGPTGIVEKSLLARDGRKIPVLFSASLMRSVDGMVQGIVCVATDITERRKAEDQVKASLREKEILLQEIHHRVKNNLQVIISLLSLQSKDIKDQKVLKMFKESQDRVHSISLVHEGIYRSKDLANIKLESYVKKLTSDLLKSYKVTEGAIVLKMDVEDMSIGIDTSIPCGLIINELLSNSLKHAFPEKRKGEIYIKIHKAGDNEIEMIFRDDGVGLPEEFDFRNPSGFGFRMIIDLVEYKLMGRIDYIRGKSSAPLVRGEGTQFQIKFKEIKYRNRI